MREIDEYDVIESTEPEAHAADVDAATPAPTEALDEAIEPSDPEPSVSLDEVKVVPWDALPGTWDKS